jgi:hypothetical protein
MKPWIAGIAALTLATCAGMTVQALRVEAQTKPGDTMKKDDMMKKPGDMKGTEIEGQVKDVKGEQITLSDGTVLTVPKSQAKAAELKTGTKVKATYEERDGRKMVTSLRIMTGPQTK